VARASSDEVRKSATCEFLNLADDYIDDLSSVIDMEAIRKSGIRIGVDPLDGAAIAYWKPIADRYGLNIEVTNPTIDPCFGFMTLDHDGKIRMECSNPHAMAGLLSLKNRFDIAWGNDADADRHGIVTLTSGLTNPNHFLAVAIHYLVKHRQQWPVKAAIGKTLVSSTAIDLVAADVQREICEMPVGFKWFSAGLLDGEICFAGEESAGASFLRRDGSAWTTDKDGIILGLLAAEITAVTGRDPAVYYERLVGRLGRSYSARVDSLATTEAKETLKKIRPASIADVTLAGDPILKKTVNASGNGTAIGGIKVETTNGWFAARPQAPRIFVKIYAESFRSSEHLAAILGQARQIVSSLQ